MKPIGRRPFRRVCGFGGPLAALVLLGSCSPAVRPSAEPPAPSEALVRETARSAGLRLGPALTEMGIGAEAAARGLRAFRISCPALLNRSDASELTRAEDWASACGAAAAWPDNDAFGFFARYFETAQVGDGKAFATGYFEPRIAGSKVRAPGYSVPLYGLPGDLVDADLGLFSESLEGKHIRGRVEQQALIPYYDRGEIEDGALAGRGLELAWAADAVDLFFLQIQGSGQLALPDGSVMRIGYAGQNGRDYVAVGRLLKERGLIEGPATMQAIAAWLRAHPAEGDALMRENSSYVFFRPISGPGPVGALGRPLTPVGSAAADPRFVPLGAPFILATDRTEANGLWIAQDTGGAIKGANRFDTFWGAGEEAARIAGGMSAHGRAFLLLPKGSVARMTGAPLGEAPAGE